MPQTITSPDGAEYHWDKDTPPTQADIDAIVAHTLSRQKLQSDWAQAGPMDRIKLLASHGAETLANMGIEGAAGAIGGVVGSRFGKAGQAIGSGTGMAIGNTIVQLKDYASGKQKEIDPGQIAGAFVSGAVPANNLAGAGVEKTVGEGLKYAVANIAGTATEKAIDEKRLPSPTEVGQAALGGVVGAQLARATSGGKGAAAEAARMSQDIPRNNTLKLAMDLGYALDPALANPSPTNHIVDRIAGQSQIQRQAIFQNQKVTNAIARAELGMDPAQPLTRESLAVRAFQIAEPYREVASISTAAAQDLKDLQRARMESNSFWRKYSREGDIDFRDKAVAADKIADTLETKLEGYATSAGKMGLVDDLRRSRALMAKLHVVKAALNPSDGNVSATVIGQMYDKGKRKLSDGLKVIADLENVMPQVMREAAVTQAVGSSSFRPFLAAGAYAAGSQVSPAVGAAAAGAVAFGDIPVRNLALSKPYQQFMNMPRYGNNNPDFAANVLRFASQSAGR